MLDLVKTFNDKINSLILSLIGNGVVLLFLAILIVWTDFMIRFVAGLIVLLISYTFLYGAYKLWNFKKDIENHLKLN